MQAFTSLLFLLLLFLLGIPTVAPVSHSLQYFYTASSEVPGFAEFVAVGLVDGEDFFYYDSNIREATPKAGWKNQRLRPDYWERETLKFSGQAQIFRVSIENNKKYFNHTGGLHLYQWLVGCEWDDETDEVNGFSGFGYDGEDFLVFDLEAERWIAPLQQAFLTKLKWDSNRAWIVQQKHYLTHICPAWLKDYRQFEGNLLKRKGLNLPNPDQIPGSIRVLRQS